MEKHHEHLYKQIETFYYFHADRLPTTQFGLVKTYLWSASLALALNLSLLKEFEQTTDWGYLSIASLTIAFFVLVFALDSMRGRSNHEMENPDFSAYLTYFDNPDWDNPLHARTVIKDFSDSLILLQKRNNWLGLRLRAMSSGCILSFSLLAIAAIGGFIFK